MGVYVKGGFISEMSPALITAILEGFQGHPARGTQFFFQHCGGAIARVAPDASAFPHRSAHANMLAAVAWRMGDESTEHVRWIRQYWSTLEPFTKGFYVNDADPNATGRGAEQQLPGQLPAAGGAQEPVRSDESVPAQCECETDSELSDRPPSKPRRAGAIMFEDPLGGNRAAGTGRDGVPRVRQRGAGVRRVSVRRLRHVHLRDLLDARRHPVQGVPGEGRQRRTAPGQLIP
jgi:hypothetical protein